MITASTWKALSPLSRKNAVGRKVNRVKHTFHVWEKTPTHHSRLTSLFRAQCQENTSSNISVRPRYPPSAPPILDSIWWKTSQCCTTETVLHNWGWQNGSSVTTAFHTLIHSSLHPFIPLAIHPSVHPVQNLQSVPARHRAEDRGHPRWAASTSHTIKSIYLHCIL